MPFGQRKIEILLDNPNHTFSPGEIVAGRVTVNFNQPESIRGLKVSMTGKAEVRWGKPISAIDNQTASPLTSEEDYFTMAVDLLGKTDVQTGCHFFPFKFRLPLNIPSSFETRNGSIRYTVKAVMEKQWRFDYKTSIALNVETPYDLSECTSPMTAIDDEEYKTFCCFPCLKIGAMRVNIFLATRGFTIGEAIQARIDIINTSTSVDVTEIKLQIEQVIKFYSRHIGVGTRSQTSIVKSVNKNGPFDKMDEIFVGIQVPLLPYSDMVYCSLIDIKYNLKVLISVSGCYYGLKRKYPIVIGTKSALSNQQKPTKIPAPMPTTLFFPGVEYSGRPVISKPTLTYGSTLSTTGQKAPQC